MEPIPSSQGRAEHAARVRALYRVRAVGLALRDESQRHRVDAVPLVRLGVTETLPSEHMPEVAVERRGRGGVRGESEARAKPMRGQQQEQRRRRRLGAVARRDRCQILLWRSNQNTHRCSTRI